jgi:hypothetical protein
MKTTAMTYVERSQKLDTKAHKALLTGIGRDWKAVEEAATEAGKQTVVAVNRMRACGDKLKQLCGHDQITLEFYSTVKSQLPKSMQFTAARSAVHISNRLSADVNTVQEAMAVQRELFTALDEYREPKRLAQQTAHDVNPWSELVSKAMGFTAFFGQLMEDEPMEAWGQDKLSNFVSTTNPIVDANTAAKALLK